MGRLRLCVTEKSQRRRSSRAPTRSPLRLTRVDGLHASALRMPGCSACKAAQRAGMPVATASLVRDKLVGGTSWRLPVLVDLGTCQCFKFVSNLNLILFKPCVSPRACSPRVKWKLSGGPNFKVGPTVAPGSYKFTTSSSLSDGWPTGRKRACARRNSQQLFSLIYRARFFMLETRTQSRAGDLSTEACAQYPPDMPPQRPPRRLHYQRPLAHSG